MIHHKPAKGSCEKHRDNEWIGIVGRVILFAIVFCIIYFLAGNKPSHFDYNGHSYIRFYQSTVHDPDCQNPEHFK